MVLLANGLVGRANLRTLFRCGYAKPDGVAAQYLYCANRARRLAVLVYRVVDVQRIARKFGRCSDTQIRFNHHLDVRRGDVHFLFGNG